MPYSSIRIYRCRQYRCRLQISHGKGWGKGGKEVEGNGVLRHLKIEGGEIMSFSDKSL